MSAFVCILERSGADADPAELLRLAEPLAHHGSETALLCRGPVGIAVRHRGGTGRRGLHGPLEDQETGRIVAVAGRFRILGDPAADAAAVPRTAPGGAARLLAGPPELDDVFLAGLAGPFTLIAAEPESRSVTLVRDHLGSLKVHYALDAGRLIAASEAAALLRHDRVSDTLDEASVARFLGFRFTHGERSFFREVRELPPAHRLRVTPARARSERYWRFRRLPSAPGRSPEEAPAEILERLRRAVDAETAGLEPERVALSLSGGLDSTAVAAVAPRGVRAFSWTFDETPDADERSRIEAVSDHLDLPVRWVPGDGLHPLCDGFADRFVHESSPYVNAFAALKARLYGAAREAGCERVLVGDGGDVLYAAREYWLRDALASGRPGALRSLAGTVGRAARGDRFARLSLVRIFPVRGLRTALRPNPTPWLTPEGRSALPEIAPSPTLPPGRHRARWELAVGAKHTEVESEEQRLFAQCGVERGNPFWSWPLLEMAIQLPATWSHRDGRSKILARKALRGLLPERVLEGGRVGLLGSFFLRGIEERREDLRERVFRHPRSDWRRYVRRDWLEPYLAAAGEVSFGHTILWRVICYELWIRRLIGGAGGGSVDPTLGRRTVGDRR